MQREPRTREQQLERPVYNQMSRKKEELSCAHFRQEAMARGRLAVFGSDWLSSCPIKQCLADPKKCMRASTPQEAVKERSAGGSLS